MTRSAIFPGSFDPITVGHVDIINRALPLFDRIYVAIGHNSLKQCMFPAQRRLHWVAETFKDEPKVIPVRYKGLTVNYCLPRDIRYILRGIRYVSDFESEKIIADINRRIGRRVGGIDTVFFTCLPEHGHVASTLVRELLRNNGDITPFVPEAVLKGISL